MSSSKLIRLLSILAYSYSFDNSVESSRLTSKVTLSNETKSHSEKEPDQISDVHNPGSQAMEFEIDKISVLVHLPTTDLNKFLDDVVFPGPAEPSCVNKTKLNFTKKHKKRMRKSIYQVKVLKQEYKLNPNWEKEDMIAVGKKAGLEYHQVYKWYWEQSNRRD